MENTLGAIIRASILYVFALAVIRATGKRTIGPIGPMDLVVAFAIGDMFDDIIWGSVSVATGFTAMGTIAFLQVRKEKGEWRIVSLDPLR